MVATRLELLANFFSQFFVHGAHLKTGVRLSTHLPTVISCEETDDDEKVEKSM